MGCSVCGSIETRPDIEKNGYQYVLCSGCGISMIDPMPEQESLDGLYQEGFLEISCDGVSMVEHFSAEYRESYFKEKDLDFSDLAYKFISSDMKVLDVGSANGLFLDYLQKRHNIRGEGIDISREMTDAAVAKGFDCQCKRIEDVCSRFIRYDYHVGHSGAY
ncbi:MAG: methionine biosynthesis protein MetW [Thermodesulfobacteriota bacterium]